MDYKHGYLLVGDLEKAEDEALSMASKILGKEKDGLKTHPDFLFVEESPLSINTARDIRAKSSKKSFFGKGRVFVIKTNFFTREAMNALLKTLEEPVGLNRFFLITSSKENLLETLRSRLMVLDFEVDQKLSREKEKFVLKFLKLPASKRIEMVSSFEDDKEKIFGFLGGVEIVLRGKLVSNFPNEFVSALGELNKQRNFISRRGIKPKIITEYLCLVLPRL